MTPPDPAREAAILARCEAATKGPWEWEEFPLEDDRHRSALIHDTVGVLYHQACWRVRDADTAFIAYAREDVPWLLAQLDAARARVRALEGERAQARQRVAEMEGGLEEILQITAEIEYGDRKPCWPVIQRIARRLVADQPMVGPDAGKGVGE